MSLHLSAAGEAQSPAGIDLVAHDSEIHVGKAAQLPYRQGLQGGAGEVARHQAVQLREVACTLSIADDHFAVFVPFILLHRSLANGQPVVRLLHQVGRSVGQDNDVRRRVILLAEGVGYGLVTLVGESLHAPLRGDGGRVEGDRATVRGAVFAS